MHVLSSLALVGALLTAMAASAEAQPAAAPARPSLRVEGGCLSPSAGPEGEGMLVRIEVELRRAPGSAPAVLFESLRLGGGPQITSFSVSRLEEPVRGGLSASLDQREVLGRGWPTNWPDVIRLQIELRVPGQPRLNARLRASVQLRARIGDRPVQARGEVPICLGVIQ